MPRPGFRISIANPLTLVGKELQTILHDRGIPYAHMELINTARGDDAETLTQVAAEVAVVRPVAEDSFLGADIVFFCGDGSTNEPWIQRANEEGSFVIDLSQPSAVTSEAIPIVAGVNEHQIEEHVIAISPHPVAVPIALILHQLRGLGEIRSCAVSAIQPASELDQRGIDELFKQTIGALNLSKIPKDVFDRQVAFNLYPAAGGAAHERYVIGQLEQVIGNKPKISLSLTQGTVFHGHSLSIFIELAEPVDLAEVMAQLDKSEALEVSPNDDPAATLDAAGRDQILIGRVHANAENTNTFSIWAVADNLRRSSALNAVLIAEEFIARFGEKPN